MEYEAQLAHADQLIDRLQTENENLRAQNQHLTRMVDWLTSDGEHEHGSVALHPAMAGA